MLRLLAFTLILIGTPGDDPKVIPAAEAKNHLDKEIIVELKVQLSKDADKQKEHYLDSEADYHDPNNLAIVIHYDDLEAFKKAGIDSPSKYYLNKTIRVTGTPKKESQQIRLRVTDPKSIKVVEVKKP